jgi:hypothetical protein
MKTLFTNCSQLNNFGALVAALLTARSDEFRANTVERKEIAERHGERIKEQYEALARQWLASLPRVA